MALPPYPAIVTGKHEVVLKTQYHIKGGSYKNTDTKMMGWEVEKGMHKATPQGGWWINTSLDSYHKGLVFDIVEAK